MVVSPSGDKLYENFYGDKQGVFIMLLDVKTFSYFKL